MLHVVILIKNSNVGTNIFLTGNKQNARLSLLAPDVGPKNSECSFQFTYKHALTDSVSMHTALLFSFAVMLWKLESVNLNIVSREMHYFGIFF